MAWCIIATPLNLSASGDDIQERRDRFKQKTIQKKSRSQQYQRDFSQTIRQRHNAFSDLIKKQWQDFQLKAGAKNPYRKKPKPQHIRPLSKPKDRPVSNLPQIKSPTLPKAKPFIPPSLPRQLPSDVFPIKINLWGNDVALAIPRQLVNQGLQNGNITENDVRAYWETARKDTSNIITQAQKIKTKMKLNDWGYILILHKIASVLFPDNAGARLMLVWLCGQTSQMDLRLALSQDHPVLLMASKQTIFQTPRLMIAGQYYYVAPLPNEHSLSAGQKLKTYPANDRRTIARSIDLKMRQPPQLGGSDAKKLRQLVFSFGHRTFQIKVPRNQTVLNYMADFPLADFSVFVDAPLSNEAAAAIRSQIKPITDRLAAQSKADAVNFLLRFVQTAFRYENDQNRIGHEDYLFGEETLHAASSDCEDRVALFAWLVTNLLDIRTVAVFWPGHLAAAVRLDSMDDMDGMDGHGITYRGQKYIYADPTYINANIGRAVPPYETKKPARVIGIGR